VIATIKNLLPTSEKQIPSIKTKVAKKLILYFTSPENRANALKKCKRRQKKKTK